MLQLGVGFGVKDLGFSIATGALAAIVKPMLRARKPERQDMVVAVMMVLILIQRILLADDDDGDDDDDDGGGDDDKDHSDDVRMWMRMDVGMKRVNVRVNQV